MRPDARAATAAALLDEISGGAPAEKALTTWARRSRFAGSGDRAAIRDTVFDILRRRRTCAALGGGETGRALLLGLCRLRGDEPRALFTGAPYALPPLTAEESAPPAPGGDLVDLPDWAMDRLRRDHGSAADAIAHALGERAAVFLRANLARTDRDGAVRALSEEGIMAVPHALASTALEVVDGARRLRGSRAFSGGLIEFQDAASQAAVETVADRVPGRRCLDYCAGGGGKALALAALGGEVTAHDIDARRMRDLPERAARGGVEIAVAPPGSVQGVWDIVFVDAPCSGSGAWRRQPDARWRTGPEDIARLTALQDEVMGQAAGHVAPAGMLAYATCSLFAEENGERVAGFLGRGGWARRHERQFLPADGGDGFYVAILERDDAGAAVPRNGSPTP